MIIYLPWPRPLYFLWLATYVCVKVGKSEYWCGTCFWPRWHHWSGSRKARKEWNHHDSVCAVSAYARRGVSRLRITGWARTTYQDACQREVEGEIDGSAFWEKTVIFERVHLCTGHLVSLFSLLKSVRQRVFNVSACVKELVRTRVIDFLRFFLRILRLRRESVCFRVTVKNKLIYLDRRKHAHTHTWIRSTRVKSPRGLPRHRLDPPVFKQFSSCFFRQKLIK